MTVFRVTAEHTARGWWVLEADEVGAVSQVRRLDKAAPEMREAIAYLSGLPQEEIEIEIEPILPASFEQAQQRSLRLRAAADELSAEAAAANREAAMILAAEGMSVREIGALMSVSPQRASQLTRSN